MSVSASSCVSFMVEVGRLPARGMPVEFVADESQRRTLAKVHGVRDVRRFKAALLVSPWKRDGVRVSGTVEADIVQECVVTLEPLEQAIVADVLSLFLPEGSPLARNDAEAGELVLDPEADDPPEPFTGGTIDAGQVAEEFFALAIDPYPRRPEAALEKGENADGGDDAPEGARGPMFDALSRLAKKE